MKKLPLSLTSLFTFVTIFILLSCDNPTDILDINQSGSLFSETSVRKASDTETLRADKNFQLLISDLLDLEKVRASVKIKKSDQIALMDELRQAENEQEVSLVLLEYFENSALLLKHLQKINKSIIKLKDENTFIASKNITTEQKQEILKTVIVEELRNGRAKKLAGARSEAMNDCGGTCSSQFNIDMDECDAGLALGIGGSLMFGVLNPFYGSGALLVVGVGYYICEGHSIDTLGNCFDGCR